MTYRNYWMTNINNRHALQLILLFGVISISFLFIQTVQLGFTQEIKTFKVKAELDDKAIKRGDTQTIDVTVEDEKSDSNLSLELCTGHGNISRWNTS